MSHCTKIIFVLVLIGLGANITQSQANPEDFTRSILSAQIREIKSNIMNEEFELIIQLPYNYEKEAPKKYPALYYCDGYYDTPLWSGIYGVQFYDKTITDCILIGFSYKGKNRDYEKLRARDYTPTGNAMSGAYGNAGQFLEVVEKELIPFVEKNYRTDPAFRALGGCSLGGLFTLYVMLNRTNLFDSYIAISPAVWWDNFWLLKKEELYHEKNDDLPVSLFMSVGEKEELYEAVMNFHKILESRNYRSIRYKFRVLENTYHAGSKPEGYHRGLQFIFESLIRR